MLRRNFVQFCVSALVAPLAYFKNRTETHDATKLPVLNFDDNGDLTNINEIKPYFIKVDTLEKYQRYYDQLWRQDDYISDEYDNLWWENIGQYLEHFAYAIGLINQPVEYCGEPLCGPVILCFQNNGTEPPSYWLMRTSTDLHLKDVTEFQVL